MVWYDLLTEIKVLSWKKPIQGFKYVSLHYRWPKKRRGTYFHIFVLMAAKHLAMTIPGGFGRPGHVWSAIQRVVETNSSEVWDHVV